jgi:hypothetical protein
VTPGVSWKEYKGDPSGAGGSDYSTFPKRPYWLDLDRLERPGASPLLELPVTIMDPNPDWAIQIRHRLPSGPRRIWRKFFPGSQWLRPNGSNRRLMSSIVKYAAETGEPMVEFMIHSSEFMPGGSPYFPTAEAVERLFEDIEVLFEMAQKYCVGNTLTEFARKWPVK